MITLVNYGLGNIQAFANIYKRLNIPITAAENPDQLKKAEKIILPGVGAFDWAMERLESSGMRSCLDDLVMEKNKPVLGICVGMQMMALGSDEGILPGLGWIDANVKRFDVNGFSPKTRLPHMGWNDVAPQSTDCIFNGISDPRFYFLHSYYFEPKKRENVLAVTDYNRCFASAIRSGNVFGTQFHPEKSHHWGMQVLKNFANF
jgi:glutamine amidotransferase